MQIRDFRITDYNEVLNLWKTCGLILRPGDDLDGIMGAWDGRRGWINHLAVKPNRRRVGIGRALIGEVERRLLKKGAKKINAQIYQWNKASLVMKCTWIS